MQELFVIFATSLMAAAGTDWVSHTLEGLVLQMEQLKSGLGVHGTNLGLTQQEIVAASADCDAITWFVRLLLAHRVHVKQLTGLKDILFNGGAATFAVPDVPVIAGEPSPMVSPGALARIRVLVQRLKLHPNYTEVIGMQLGVVLAQAQAVLQPTAEAIALAGYRVQVNWVKAGHTGVIIFSRRGSETEWTQLGIDLVSPYVDTRAPLVAGQQEERQYRLQYLAGDDPVGEFSEIIVVTAHP